MSNPKLLSLGFAVPPRAYTQDEICDLLGYKSKKTRSIFHNAQIDRRHLWTIPVGKSWNELLQEYKEGAQWLSLKAIEQCLHGSDDIGLIVFASTTGFQCPAMSYRIAAALHLPPEVEHFDLVGAGCQSSAPALRRAWDFTKLTGESSLVVSTEVCSVTYYPASEDDLENTVACAIFGDGAGACLVGYDEVWWHPEIVDFESQFDPRYVDMLGYEWVEGRLKVVLSREVPRVAPLVLGPLLDRLLSRNCLTLEQIEHLVIHPGGAAVLNSIKDAFSIPEKKLEPSRRILREFGNVSSATIAGVGSVVRNQAKPGEYILVLTMGAGFGATGILLRFGGNITA